MIGIDSDKARSVFAVGGFARTTTAVAIGYLGTPQDIPDTYAERDTKPRVRKPINDIVIRGAF